MWWKCISFLVTWQCLWTSTANLYDVDKDSPTFFVISYLDSFTPSKTLKVLAFQWYFDFTSLGKLCGNGLTVRLTPGTTGRNDTCWDAWGSWTWGRFGHGIVLDLYVSDDRSGSSQKNPQNCDVEISVKNIANFWKRKHIGLDCLIDVSRQEYSQITSFWMTNEMFAGGLEVDVESNMTGTPGSALFSQRFTFVR